MDALSLWQPATGNRLNPDPLTLAFYFLFIVVLSVAMVKPAQSEGIVSGSSAYIWAGSYTSCGAMCAADAANPGWGPSGPSCANVVQSGASCTYDILTAHPVTTRSRSYTGVPICPANSTKSGTTCICNARYVPDPAATSCIPEQYTITLPNPLADVEPSGTTNVYADTSRAVYALVTDKQTELPQIGVQVKFSVDVIAGTGGHDHHDALRPKGTLLDCRDNTTEVESTVCITQLDGKATVTFKAPIVSGTHTITAECVSPACTGPASGDINVKVDGLWPIPAYSQWYALRDSKGEVIGAFKDKHSDNHYLTGAAIVKLKTLANVYAQINNGQPLYLNDASLIWGGLFDVGNTSWKPPHAGHRRGTGLDIRAANSGPNNEGAVPATLFGRLSIKAAQKNIKAALHCTQNNVSYTGAICNGIPNNRHFHVDF